VISIARAPTRVQHLFDDAERKNPKNHVHIARPILYVVMMNCLDDHETSNVGRQWTRCSQPTRCSPLLCCSWRELVSAGVGRARDGLGRVVAYRPSHAFSSEMELRREPVIMCFSPRHSG